MGEQEQMRIAQARRALFEVYRDQAASVWVAACGDSMRPLIQPGASLLVEFGALPALPGEIVVFPAGDRLVAHRVVALRREQDATVVVAKGDAEAFCDPPLPLSGVLGVVRAVRYSPDGPVVQAGCSGWEAQSIAWISYWSSRSASAARRVAAFLPDPLRGRAIDTVSALVRAAARIVFTPLYWVAQLHGELHLNRV
jgi:hypothetical protein